MRNTALFEGFNTEDRTEIAIFERGFDNISVNITTLAIATEVGLPRTEFTLWVQVLGMQVSFAHFTVTVCGYNEPKLVEMGARYTVKILGPADLDEEQN